MSIQPFIEAVHTLDQAIPQPSPFVSGLIFGMLIGMVLASIIPGRHALGTSLRRTLLAVFALVPPVVAALLWGAWIGILAAKGLVH